MKQRKLFDDKIDVIYFDATTIYFESFTEDIGDDAIRKNGYSKDLKFNQPQVVLALMVTKGIAYWFMNCLVVIHLMDIPNTKP